MQTFSLRVPSSIVFGQDVLPQLGQIARDIGTRALIVSESVLHEGQHISRVVEILKRSGVETMIYDELMPGSPASTVDDIASLARASKAQSVIGLGGMRVLSIARCVANVAAACDASDHACRAHRRSTCCCRTPAGGRRRGAAGAGAEGARPV